MRIININVLVVGSVSTHKVLATMSKRAWVQKVGGRRTESNEEKTIVRSIVERRLKVEAEVNEEHYLS